MRTRSGRRRKARVEREPEVTAPPAAVEPVAFELSPTDPLMHYLQQAGGPVEIDKLKLDSPGLEQMRKADVALVVPLVSQGELIGVLSLGPRLSEQQYSADDRKLLENLASTAAPALRVAQLVREEEANIQARERYQQELRIAHLIQQNFLPREQPDIAGWTLSAFYRSAREVGGDFYDFIELDNGRIGVVIGDVTDKGVPAALMMASTRSVLRSVAARFDSPGTVLEHANELLCPDMPPKMFVTCLYAILEPHSGKLVYANAGHNVPYRRRIDCVDELKARGMPLGLLPGSKYEEKDVMISPGEIVLFSSDGIAEAHSTDGEMFGCPRIIDVVTHHASSADLRNEVLDSLHAFTGAEWDQEDDITMVVLDRLPYDASDFAASGEERLATFEIASETGNERAAMQRVVEVVEGLGIDPTRLDKLKTAVAEATMNAIEHGNHNDPDLPVTIEVTKRPRELRVAITDHGGGAQIPDETAPDIDAKLRGEQTPRGWGLFLIKNMVDDMIVTSDEVHHTVTLVFSLGGES